MAKIIKSACKKTSKKLLRIWGAILAFFLGLSGMNCPLYGVAEYGMPYAEFTVSGKVKSSENQAGIFNIRVSVLGDIEMLSEQYDYTNVAGDYSVTFITLGARNMEVTLKFEDIDDTEYGSFADTEVVVTIDEVDFIDDTPDNEWDDGEGSKTIPDVELDPIV